MLPCEQLLEIMACCHSLTLVNGAMIGELYQEKLD